MQTCRPAELVVREALWGSACRYFLQKTRQMDKLQASSDEHVVRFLQGDEHASVAEPNL